MIAIASIPLVSPGFHIPVMCACIQGFLELPALASANFLTPSSRSGSTDFCSLFCIGRAAPVVNGAGPVCIGRAAPVVNGAGSLIFLAPRGCLRPFFHSSTPPPPPPPALHTHAYTHILLHPATLLFCVSSDLPPWWAVAASQASSGGSSPRPDRKGVNKVCVCVCLCVCVCVCVYVCTGGGFSATLIPSLSTRHFMTTLAP